jgi:hypothetical protein
MLFAGVPAMREPFGDADAKQEREIAEMQRKLQQLRQRDEVGGELLAEQHA